MSQRTQIESSSESSSSDELCTTSDDGPWEFGMDRMIDPFRVPEIVPQIDPVLRKTITDTIASQQHLDTTTGVNVTQSLDPTDRELQLSRLQDEWSLTREQLDTAAVSDLRDVPSWFHFLNSEDKQALRQRPGEISDATSELMRNLRMPLLLFTDDEADTFVYIDPAPQQPQRHHWLPAIRVESGAIPHRVHSRVLLGSNSAVLRNLFEPRNQSRVRRSRGLTGNMPPGIRYAIDLSPASEGDDALIFMTELSCPMGIRTWSKYQRRWNLPGVCVAGQEEVEWLPEPAPVVKIETPAVPKKKMKNPMGKNVKQLKRTEPPRVMNWAGELPILPLAQPEGNSCDQKMTKGAQQDTQPEQIKKIPGLPLDYSPIRHRTCLERILHALEGLDPKLDSAPKLWTFFALAKLLEVAALPSIGDRILMWLYDASNTMFVEIHPELSYQISCGVQNLALCQDSFAILVGEEALLLLLAEVNGETPPRLSWTLHGRHRETLDDMETQRIEYASKGFVERILNAFVDFAGTKMIWVSDLVRQNIKGIPLLPEMASAIDNLTRFLQNWIRVHIYFQMHVQPGTSTDFNSHNDYPGIDFYKAPVVMPSMCRVLTRTFWNGLKLSAASLLPYAGRVRRSEEHASLKSLAPNLPVLKDQDDATIHWIAREDLVLAVDTFNELANYHRVGISQFLNSSSQQSSPRLTCFDLPSFEADVANYFAKIEGDMTGPPDADRASYGVRFDMVDTLVCLGEDEFKFLPLWAGGNDDGTGGVFNDQDVPILESGGFSTAGPMVHTGSTVSSVADSMESFDMVYPSDVASTVQRASHRATDSHTTESDVLSLDSTAMSSVGGELREDFQSLDLEDGPDGDGHVPEIDIDMDIPNDTHNDDNDDNHEFYDEDMSDDGTMGAEASDDESFALDAEYHRQDPDLEDFEFVTRD